LSRKLIRSSAFIRVLKRFLKKHPKVEVDFQTTLNLLAKDAFDPRLRTHKLKGDLAGIWACSAGRDLRVLFEFVENEGAEAIFLLTVGTHDEVY